MDQVKAIVHDQASNMELTGRTLEEEFECENLSCAAHRLQLCINEGLEINAVSRAIGAGRKLVTHFRHSALATTELQKCQKAMGLPSKRLQQDCPTHWNSTYYMVQSLLVNRWPLTAVLSDETVTKRQYRYLDLSSDNWMILEDLVKPLQPLEVATVFLSEEHNTSLSAVLPIVHGLVSQLVSTEDDSATMRQFKVTVSSTLRRRWSLDNIAPKKVSVLATALDARFRTLKFLTEDQKLAVRAELLSLMTAADGESNSTVSPPSPKRQKTAFDILLGEQDEGENTSIEDELHRYFTEKVAPRNSNPLEWWKQNSFRFPVLTKVARLILCIPATSTSSERLFSTAGLTVTKLRSCLKPENVDALVFLNKNFEYLFLSLYIVLFV